MTEIVNGLEGVVGHVKVSTCAFCKNTGHTISKCTSPAIQKLADESVGVANYCIAFHPNSILLEAYIDSMSGTQINVIRRKIGLKCRDDKSVILKKLYTDKVSIDDSRAVAKTALEQTGALAIMQRKILRSYIANILVGEERVYDSNGCTIRYIAPCCPEEQAILVQAQQEVRIEAHNFEVDRARRNLERNRATVTRLREQLAAANTAVINSREVLRVLRTLDEPAAIRRFTIKTDVKADRLIENTDCPICLEDIPLDNLVVTGCNHTVCNGCLTTILTKVQSARPLINPCCAMCRREVNKLTFGNEVICQEITAQFCVVTL
jgi:hypothetical protein